ncbi:MAG: right-handed parallel beta-helix repeat-containing protein [Rubripirellula sp.]|nr:right-handed parallel beta-helix repeat-containing protein [Rubripirellula sp.]
MMNSNTFLTISFIVLTLATLNPTRTQAQWQKAAEQVPDIDSLPDSTDKLQSLIDSQKGSLVLTEKFYRINRSLTLRLGKHGAASITSNNSSTLIMAGPGPAISVLGNHIGTASPKSFSATTWNEHMPTFSGFEILGGHPKADGINLQQTVGAILERMSIRWCRHGIHLTTRNRNVIVANCHLYENSGVGLYLDDVNLHQINVNNSHISYNREGGIVVRDGNVRNLQVTGCDIEGNMPDDTTKTRTANIWIDVSGAEQDTSRSIAEIAITGNTIQHSANYGAKNDKTIAPGGANIRLSGKAIYPINSVTISGNILSDTSTLVDIQHSHDVTVSGNTFFAPKPNNLNVEHSQRVVVMANTFNPRQFVRPGVIKFSNCTDCMLANSTLFRLSTDSGGVRFSECSGCLLTGLIISQCQSGIHLRETESMTISNCRVSGTPQTSFDLLIDQSNSNIKLHGNSFSGFTVVNPALSESLIDKSVP